MRYNTNLFLQASTGYGTQHTGSGLRIKRNPGLFQNPCFYFFVLHSQQLQRADGVTFLSGCTGFVSLYLRR